MAGGAVHGAPYFAAFNLSGWAAANIGYVRGRVRLAGHDPDTLAWVDWCDVVEAVLVDLPDGMVDRFQWMEKLDESLHSPPWVDRETWGASPSAEAGMRAMMELAGPPATRRDPKDEPAA